MRIVGWIEGRSASTKVNMLIAGLALVGLVLQPVLPGAGLLGVEIPWWGMALGFMLAGCCAVHLNVGRQTHTLTLVEIPLVIGLVMAAPVALIVGRLLGAATALLVFRRLPIQKVAFNLSLALTETTGAVLLFRAIAGAETGMSPIVWVGGLVAMAAVQAIGVAAVGGVIGLTGGNVQGRSVIPSFAVSGGATVAGLAAATLAVHDLRLVAAAVALGGLLYLAAAAVIASRARAEALRTLATLDGAGSGPFIFEQTVLSSLLEGRQLLRVEDLEMVISTSAGLVRYALSEGGNLQREPVATGEVIPLEAILSGAGDAESYLRRRGFADGMVGELRRASRVVGVLIAANRIGPQRRFDDTDRSVLQLLAGRAAALT